MNPADRVLAVSRTSQARSTKSCNRKQDEIDMSKHNDLKPIEGLQGRALVIGCGRDETPPLLETWKLHGCPDDVTPFVHPGVTGIRG